MRNDILDDIKFDAVFKFGETEIFRTARIEWESRIKELKSKLTIVMRVGFLGTASCFLVFFVATESPDNDFLNIYMSGICRYLVYVFIIAFGVSALYKLFLQVYYSHPTIKYREIVFVTNQRLLVFDTEEDIVLTEIELKNIEKIEELAEDVEIGTLKMKVNGDAIEMNSLMGVKELITKILEARKMLH